MKPSKFNIILLDATIDTVDPERAILPALIYTREAHSSGTVIAHMISIGWWAWGIGFVWCSYPRV